MARRGQSGPEESLLILLLVRAGPPCTPSVPPSSFMINFNTGHARCVNRCKHVVNQGRERDGVRTTQRRGLVRLVMYECAGRAAASCRQALAALLTPRSSTPRAAASPGHNYPYSEVRLTLKYTGVRPLLGRTRDPSRGSGAAEAQPTPRAPPGCVIPGYDCRGHSDVASPVALHHTILRCVAPDERQPLNTPSPPLTPPPPPPPAKWLPQ